MFGNFFGKAKDTVVKKMIKAQLKDLPKDQREMIEAMVEKNPDLFVKIAKEAQALVKGGKDQMSAMMEVSKKYRKELEQLGRQI